jgi:hypothetical protein
VTEESGTAECGVHVDGPLGVVGSVEGDNDRGNLVRGGSDRNGPRGGDKSPGEGVERGGACHGGG